MKYVLLALALLLTMSGYGTETILTVRVKARDAKFIGSSIGGAEVFVRDARTGELLTSGTTKGSTGNTSLIMKTPLERGMRLSDEQTASFVATLDIDDPLLLTIEAFAPRNQRQAVAQASVQIWLIPGKHIEGDGIVLELPGFVIDVLAPRTHESLSVESLPDGKLDVRANIVMMCGCPIENGGLWDAREMEVGALVRRDGEWVGELKMQSVSTNLFEGRMEVNLGGLYELTVYAYNPKTGNTGVDKVNIIIN